MSSRNGVSQRRLRFVVDDADVLQLHFIVQDTGVVTTSATVILLVRRTHTAERISHVLLGWAWETVLNGRRRPWRRATAVFIKSFELSSVADTSSADTQYA